MKRRQEMAEEAERQRIKEEQEAKAASEAAEQAKRDAERRDDVDVGIAHDEAGAIIQYINCDNNSNNITINTLTLQIKKFINLEFIVLTF